MQNMLRGLRRSQWLWFYFDRLNILFKVYVSNHYILSRLGDFFCESYLQAYIYSKRKLLFIGTTINSKQLLVIKMEIPTHYYLSKRPKLDYRPSSSAYGLRSTRFLERMLQNTTLTTQKLVHGNIEGRVISLIHRVLDQLTISPPSPL